MKVTKVETKARSKLTLLDDLRYEAFYALMGNSMNPVGRCAVVKYYFAMPSARKKIDAIHWLHWVIPLVLLLGLTVVFWVTDLDRSFSARFYDPVDKWPVGGQQPWAFFKHYGVVPAWVLSLAALALLLASIRVRRFAPHRRPCLFFVLVMIVGPGLIVNTLFKDNWGRPRPKDLVEFGGPKQFVEVWVKNEPSGGNSFASGHAATAFYLLTPYFFFRRRCWKRASFFLFIGLAYGSLVGMARILQGAHFLSDVLWAAGFVYLSGLVFSHVLRLDIAKPSERA